MEATLFKGWIYDHLKPPAAAVKLAHPLMPPAIAAAKEKNDRIDAHPIYDCLRCDFLPECYMVSTAIREPRHTLRCGDMTADGCSVSRRVLPGSGQLGRPRSSVSH
jgi:transposase